MDEDSLGADYDLSAWAPPPPPAGLADAVVRRAREPVQDQLARTPRSRTWWFVAAGGVAALAAVLAMMLWGVERAPKNGSGDIRASAPMALDLGPSSAAIDASAQLTWQRRGSRITVAQSRGAATWTVAGDDTLVIDSGAAVASIEASGARLRVEVSVNRSDVRAVGIGSASAIVVALVTVIVYEGHVKATSNGQTVNIQPGATMQFGTPAPPPEQYAVGGAPEDAARIRALEAEVARLKREIAERTEPKRQPPPPKDSRSDTTDGAKQTCDEVSCVLGNYEGTCCTKYKKTTTCDAKKLASEGDALLQDSKSQLALLKFEASLACQHHTDVAKRAYLAACRVKNAKKAQMYYDSIPHNPNMAQICLRYGVAVEDRALQKPGCDAAGDKKRAEDAMATGKDSAALALFERSLACKKDPLASRFAMLAACRSKNKGRAQFHYNTLPVGEREATIKVCAKSGVKIVDPVATCDADAPKLKGEDYLANGMDTAALAQFETSLRCQASADVTKKAFLAACRSKNASRAKVHFTNLGNPALAQICKRFGIDVEAP